jgi:hypothetical protein
MPKKNPDSMEERLRTVGARLDDLLANARKTKDYASKINLQEIQRQKDEVEKKLKGLRGPARAALAEVQKGIDAAWKDVAAALSRARKKFTR